LGDGLVPTDAKQFASFTLGINGKIKPPFEVALFSRCGPLGLSADGIEVL